jgi:hypothetical protein
MQFLDEHIQTLTLVVLTFTGFAILWQALEATKLGKAAVKLALLGLKQTELIQTQVHASFRPIVTIIDGTYRPDVTELNLKNVGVGPALLILAVYRSGARWSMGSLSAGQTVVFRFDNMLNHSPAPISFGGPDVPPIIEPGRTVTLRLEYQSVSGANCWTTINFPLGRTGGVEPEEVKYGIDLASLTESL